jgi:tRNA1Val (adenine37-N6)-methyltransferase
VGPVVIHPLVKNHAEPKAGSAFVREGERVDPLQRGGLRILQRPGAFCFGTDAVLLADFAAPRGGEKVADLGTGTGILPLLMSASAPTARFDGVEIQPDMADMAARSVKMNGLEGRIRIHCLDMREAAETLGRETYDLVVCNPPYSRPDRALTSPREEKALARQLCALSLEEVAASGAALLKNGGRMALVYPAARLFDLMCALRGARLEPKRLRIVQASPGAAPKLVLLDAVKNGGSQLHWQKPLVLRGEDGRETEEYRRIYHLEQ